MVCTDILLPPQAPAEYQDRATLWNAVERAERSKKAQLAYNFDIALQNEFSLEENIALARQFVSEQFVGRGMELQRQIGNLKDSAKAANFLTEKGIVTLEDLEAHIAA